MDKNAKLDMTNPAIVLESFKTEDSNSYDSALIGRSIKAIASTGKKLDARIHATGVAIMYRAMDHNDCSLMLPLVAALPKGTRRNDFVAWVHAFSNIRVNIKKDGDIVVGLLKKGSKDWAEPRPSEAFAKPFWSVEEAQRATNPFDDKAFAAAVAKLIKRAEDDNASLSPAAKAKLADLRMIETALAPAA